MVLFHPRHSLKSRPPTPAGELGPRGSLMWSPTKRGPDWVLHHAVRHSWGAKGRSHPLLGAGLTLAIPFGPARLQSDRPSFGAAVWSRPGQSRRSPAAWSPPRCCQLPARPPDRAKVLPWLMGDPQTCVVTAPSVRAPAATDLAPLPYVGSLLWHPEGCMPVCACVHMCVSACLCFPSFA